MSAELSPEASALCIQTMNRMALQMTQELLKNTAIISDKTGLPVALCMQVTIDAALIAALSVFRTGGAAGLLIPDIEVMRRRMEYAIGLPLTFFDVGTDGSFSNPQNIN